MSGPLDRTTPVQAPLEFISRLRIAPEDFWAVQSMRSVNAELAPWLHMSAPVRWREWPLQDWPRDTPLFSSWVLLCGVLPLDRHAFGTVVFTCPRGFAEYSSSWSTRAWSHERTVNAVEGGCELVDRIGFVPRIPALRGLLAR